ncbi:MAG: alanine--tRNA ligase [Bacteroidota bacterium]|nr:alanine--tRNA ligase [Bacteroidota bacterium]
MTSAEIRRKFLDFFRTKGHTIVPSAPIVIKNDPTLLFTNAGMNQFKDFFLGNNKAPHARVADTQKCLRVSGKHNDLEEVGVDTYHHTMFEMLGNWSFGDPSRPGVDDPSSASDEGYFKRSAIAWSWELLTAVYGISKDRLYVTVFEGDTKEGLPRDEEAMAEWEKWISSDRIILGKKKDNFWEMGDTGPCGPCTEVHVDCRPDEERRSQDGKSLVNKDHPQVIEIWNNVFIQFNRLKNGRLEPLPAKHVDTGMGLERLVRVLQGKTSNYDTDVFSGTIAATEQLTGKKYTAGDGRPDIAFRVLSDHIRAIAFTIADGQLPSNTGAGYVIRRILRRAVRYYYSYLDGRQPLLHRLLPGLAQQFEDVFPELKKQLDFISRVVKEEEEAFLRTLDKGIERFNAFIGPDGASLSASSDHRGDILAQRAKKSIHGYFAFELYDTFGFPVDLTELMARESGWTVDRTGFEKALEEQKTRSRAAAAVDTEDWVNLTDIPLTEFVGYDSLELNSRIAKYRKVKAKGKEAWQLVLEATPFYAESGGQVGDTGTLQSGGEIIRVTDTKKENNLIIHFTEELPAGLQQGILLRVDPQRRKAIAIHHSATHLLHAALRKVLGTHVAQKGSLVNEEQLRFDFSHFAKLTDEEIASIERLVNEKIRENIPVVIKEMPREAALEMGAMALFGEKYGNRVRVVIIDPAYSVELCGGTHVGATGELGLFKIVHESAVAAGVRRIEAVAGVAAENYVSGQFAQIRQIRETMKNPKELLRSLEGLIAENAELKRRQERAEARQLADLKDRLVTRVQVVNGVNFIGEIVEVPQADALKRLCFDLKNELNNYLVVLAANLEGKAAVAILIDEKLAADKGLQAPAIIKEHIAPLINGGGGGQKTLAMAGGQDPSRLPQVIARVKALL